MKIVVVDFAASVGGATSILKSFFQYLVISGNKNDWVFLLSDNYIEQTENIKTILLKKEKQSRIRRFTFDYIYGRKVIWELHPDAVFYLQNTLIHGVKVPQIMYMDQSIPFQSEKTFRFAKKEERTYAIYQRIIGKLNHDACKKADYTVVQTEWLKKAIADRCKISTERIIKIPPNVSDLCWKYHATKIDNTVFFYPAYGAVYKNHQCIYDALLQTEKQCRVVLTLPETDGTTDRCECIGTIRQDEVYARMEKNVLVFPSYIESYGLPLKEAMSVGTLILAADTAFSKEILQGYENAYFFNPFRPAELAELMDKVITGEIVHIPQEKAVLHNQPNTWSQVVDVIRSTQT